MEATIYKDYQERIEKAADRIDIDYSLDNLDEIMGLMGELVTYRFTDTSVDSEYQLVNLEDYAVECYLKACLETYQQKPSKQVIGLIILTLEACIDYSEKYILRIYETLIDIKTDRLDDKDLPQRLRNRYNYEINLYLSLINAIKKYQEISTC